MSMRTPAQAAVDYLNQLLPPEVRARQFSTDDGHLLVLVDTRGAHRRLPMFDDQVVAVLGCHAAPREQA